MKVWADWAVTHGPLNGAMNEVSQQQHSRIYRKRSSLDIEDIAQRAREAKLKGLQVDLTASQRSSITRSGA
jgi:hypothetical protein